MALGSGAFVSANWALTADVVPPAEAGRFLALANLGTAGGMAAAGLFGPLLDAANAASPGAGYAALFAGAALAFLASLWAGRAAARALRVPETAPASPVWAGGPTA